MATLFIFCLQKNRMNVFCYLYTNLFVDDGIILVVQLSQPTTDIRLLFLYIPLVRIYPYTRGKFYLLVPDAGHKINVRRLFGLGFSQVKIASDLVDEKLCIYKAFWGIRPF